MLTHAELLLLAFKAERAASRKLAARSGVSEQEALHAILMASAGDAGLPALVASRRQLHAQAERRAARRRELAATQRALRAARHQGREGAWRAWFDGSAHPNPGRCGIGALLTGPAGERLALSRSAGYGNSSEAEYLALIMLLEAACEVQACDLAIFGDSQVVINDVTGSDAGAARALAPLRTAARALIARLPGVTLHWLPRHKNAEADALSQLAVTNWGSEVPLPPLATPMR